MWSSGIGVLERQPELRGERETTCYEPFDRQNHANVSQNCGTPPHLYTGAEADLAPREVHASALNAEHPYPETSTLNPEHQTRDRKAAPSKGRSNAWVQPQDCDTEKHIVTQKKEFDQDLVSAEVNAVYSHSDLLLHGLVPRSRRRTPTP